MTDKLAVKMNQSPGNASLGGSHSNRPALQPLAPRPAARSSKSGPRPRERSGLPGEEHEVKGKGQRKAKKGKIMNDLVSFRLYRPPPSHYHHRSSRHTTPDFIREDYVKVSCKLLLRDNLDHGDLGLIDSSVNWEDVIQVQLACEELPSCPICLSAPICPMSPVCGHPMCYTCTLRYLDICPGSGCSICHKPLFLPDLKPLKTSTFEKITVGSEVTFRLVKRYKSGSVVCPIGEEVAKGRIPNVSTEWGSKFCNVFSATPLQILETVLLPQEEELNTQLALLDDHDRECEPYVVRALELIDEQKRECFEEMDKKQDKPCLSSGAEDERERMVYFYQSDDGQAVFLHPLNTRCLIQEYGSIEATPPLIRASIIAQEFFTQSPDQRSRYRYYAHLSLGTPFSLCEIDITPHVSRQVYEKFRPDIEKRALARSSKERKETAYSRKIAAKEREVVFHCSAYLPRYTEVSKPAPDHFKSSENYDTILATEGAGGTGGGSNGGAPLSFAEKLRHGASKSTPWVNKSTSQNDRQRMDSTNSTCSEDIDIHIPTFQTSFSASLNDAFANFDLQETQGGATSTRKKKKNKGKTISLTGGARRN